VARAFGDKSLKEHLSSEPDVTVEEIDADTEFIILASDGLWTVRACLSLSISFSVVFRLSSSLKWAVKKKPYF